MCAISNPLSPGKWTESEMIMLSGNLCASLHVGYVRQEKDGIKLQEYLPEFQIYLFLNNCQFWLMTSPTFITPVYLYTTIWYLVRNSSFFLSFASSLNISSFNLFSGALLLDLGFVSFRWFSLIWSINCILFMKLSSQMAHISFTSSKLGLSHQSMNICSSHT